MCRFLVRNGCALPGEMQLLVLFTSGRLPSLKKYTSTACFVSEIPTSDLACKGRYKRRGFGRFPLFPLLFWYKFYDEHFYSMVCLRKAGTKICSRYSLRFFTSYSIPLFESELLNESELTCKTKHTHENKWVACSIPCKVRFPICQRIGHGTF